MAPGAKSDNSNLKMISKNIQKLSRPLPSSVFSDLTLTSKDQCSVLASRNDTEIDPVSNITKDKVVNPYTFTLKENCLYPDMDYRE